MPIVSNFAKLLEEKQQKENRFITLSEVSKETGVSRKTLWKWERNTIEHFNKDVLEALMEYFGVDMAEILVHIPKTKKPAK